MVYHSYEIHYQSFKTFMTITGINTNDTQNLHNVLVIRSVKLSCKRWVLGYSIMVICAYHVQCPMIMCLPCTASQGQFLAQGKQRKEVETLTLAREHPFPRTVSPSGTASVAQSHRWWTTERGPRGPFSLQLLPFHSRVLVNLASTMLSRSEESQLSDGKQCQS